MSKLWRPAGHAAEHLGIDRWLLWGGSWGCALGILYAEIHPERVTEIVMMGIATGRQVEVDNLTRGVGRIYPEAWASFRDHLPDAVGLREIAATAGVSHGLVTHYFSTYDGLVAAVIARRFDAARTAAFAHLAQMTFAADEAPLLVIQQFLGHTDPKTTMRYIRRAEELASRAYQYNTLPL